MRLVYNLYNYSSMLRRLLRLVMVLSRSKAGRMGARSSSVDNAARGSRGPSRARNRSHRSVGGSASGVGGMRYNLSVRPRLPLNVTATG